MRDLFKELEMITPSSDPYPVLDCGTCSACGWSGSLSECETEQEGDWESGYYDVVLCPNIKCKEYDSGGCIDDYFPSEKSLAEWEAKQKETD